MSLARDVTTVGGATLASRLLGFARDVGSPAQLAALVVLVALGLAVYVASLELLGVARVRDLLAAVRRL